MDSVRFGRVLGIGTRLAAKTVVAAVDAATAPNPSAKATNDESRNEAQTTAPPPTAEKAKDPVVRLSQKAARTTAQVRQTRQGLKQGGKRFGEAVWGPFVKLSGVLWLEVTGVFFALFAVFAAGGAWKMRGELHDVGVNHEAHVRLLLALTMAVVFGYFCISSFVKASRRSRRS